MVLGNRCSRVSGRVPGAAGRGAGGGERRRVRLRRGGGERLTPGGRRPDLPGAGPQVVAVLFLLPSYSPLPPFSEETCTLFLLLPILLLLLLLLLL